ncbi:hypothetical protein D3C73_1295010 [compost metagenome]
MRSRLTLRSSSTLTQTSLILAVSTCMLWVTPLVVCINTQSLKTSIQCIKVASSGITLTNPYTRKIVTVKNSLPTAETSEIALRIILSVVTVLCTQTVRSLLKCRRLNSCIKILSSSRIIMRLKLLMIICSQIHLNLNWFTAWSAKAMK